jgi:RES domain-containing protein
MQVFRIVTRKWKAQAFAGEGARLYGGRWNPKGTAVVYTAGSRALALLEMLVQDEPLRAAYWIIPATIPDPVRIEHVTLKSLPHNWTASAHGETLRTIGRAWITRRKSAVLAVPSAAMPTETNYLLNPLHPDFDRIQIGQAQKLQTDLRLRRKFSV